MEDNMKNIHRVYDVLNDAFFSLKSMEKTDELEVSNGPEHPEAVRKHLFHIREAKTVLVTVLEHVSLAMIAEKYELND